jgi:hypothetical protein
MSLDNYIINSENPSEEVLFNIKNIFDHCYDDKVFTIKDALYSTKKIPWDNMIVPLGFNYTSEKICLYSTVWLYLFKKKFNSGEIESYAQIYYLFCHMKKYKHLSQRIKEDVVCFINSFSTGCVHGYTTIFEIIYKYLKFKEKYKKYKIIVSKKSQKGILEIINFLCETKIIDKSLIIFLDSDVNYRFNSITFIDNCHENYYSTISRPFSLNISTFITNHFIHAKFLANISSPINRICIIKSTISDNITKDGIVKQSVVEEFAKKNGLTNIEPTHYDEITLINILHSCNYIACSWGTAFMKNMVYISEKCTEILVLVNGENYTKQYKEYVNTGELLTNFKNATINYVICDL